MVNKYMPQWVQQFWTRALKLEDTFTACESILDVRKVLRWHFPTYKIIGSGAHAVVLVPPRNTSKVIRFAAFGNDYAGWWRFANVCRHYPRPHLPPIYTLLSSKNEIHMAVLKRYKSHPRGMVEQRIHDSCKAKTPMHSAIPSLTATIQFLEAHELELNDMWPENIMMDGRTPILIDPVA